MLTSPVRHAPPVRTDTHPPLGGRDLALTLLAGLLLCGGSVLWQSAKGQGWQPASQQLDRILDVDNDLSVLNWLTASTFAVAALVALGVARSGADRLPWLCLAGGVAFVSVDEAVGVHDPLQVAVVTMAGSGGPGLLAALVLGALLLLAGVLLLHLAPPVRWRVAGAVALVGLAAVGMDAVGPDLTDDPQARLGGWYVAKSTVEEALEVLAAVILLDDVRRGSPQPVKVP